MEIRVDLKDVADAQVERARRNMEIFHKIQEFRTTQPELYQAICDYGTAVRQRNTEDAFTYAGDIAVHVLALAAGTDVSA